MNAIAQPSHVRVRAKFLRQVECTLECGDFLENGKHFTLNPEASLIMASA